MVDYYWEYHSTYRGIEIEVWMPGEIAYGAELDDWIVRIDILELQDLIDDYLYEEPETWWEYDSTYREIEIQRWMPDPMAYGAWIGGYWIVRVDILELQALIDDFLAPAVDGHLGDVLYWIKGMAGWENLQTYPTKAKIGDDIHLAVYWWNDGTFAVVGNVWARLTAPDYHVYPPNAVAGQDRLINPGGGAAVQFAPVTLDHSGSWEFYSRLNLDGVQVDYKKFTFGVQEAPADIPTTLYIAAPVSVAPGEAFWIAGILIERDTGVPIVGQPISLSYNGVKLGGATTGVDGDYLLQASIPSEGTYTLKADFAGTTTLGASEASSRMSTLEVSNLLPLLAIGGLALTLIKKK